ncbi:tyrosine-type recombinase/integrase [Gemmatimonas sp.]|uniref:tyrosine-type recombinase/integrase n=1 Tax=Gemmatimonas sp. TaxID=1962908 RepID=UPI003F721A4F
MADSKRNSEYILAPVRLEPLAEDKKIVRAQSSEDIAKVLDALSPSYWRAPAVLLIETGLRHGEAQFLRKRDVELDEKVVRIQGIVKNQESVRVVPLTKAAMDAIEPIVRRTKHKDDYLFPEMAKNRWGFSQAWSRACKKAVPMRVHDLRHSFAVRLLRGGADIATTRDVLGHASIETTDRYAREAASHETHERVRKALEGVAPS